MATEIDILAESLNSFAEGLGKLFGQSCEIAIFEIEDSKQEISYIVNGHVTGRSNGDKMNLFELEALNQIETDKGYIVFCYTTKEGRNLKTAVFSTQDKEKDDTRVTSISYDITDIILAKKAFESFCLINNDVNHNSKDDDTVNVNYLMHKFVIDGLDKLGKPVSYLSKDDKISIVRELNDKGIFLIKGSVEYVAEKLCVSRYTIYNYLEEIRLEVI